METDFALNLEHNYFTYDHNVSVSCFYLCYQVLYFIIMVYLKLALSCFLKSAYFMKCNDSTFYK